MFYIAPTGLGPKGFKLMSIGAISGGVTYGIQPVYHGNLTDRGINTLIGAVSGGLMLPVAQSIRLAPRYVLPLFKGRRIINHSVAGEVANIQGIEGNLSKSYASKQLPVKHNFINESELLKHFKKHGREFKGVYTTPEEYLHGANFVIEHGHKVKYLYDSEMRVGYVRFMSNTRRGEAKFEFLALRDDGSIATYHTQRGKNFYKTLNQNKTNDCVNVEHLSCRTM